jgi:hypothetical protein
MPDNRLIGALYRLNETNQKEKEQKPETNGFYNKCTFLSVAAVRDFLRRYKLQFHYNGI